jgi:putative ABC transport system permease protein
MRLVDLISLILDNLSRRKTRVALTAVGVIIGTAAVVILVSLGIGLQQNATSQLYGIGDLTQIYVDPVYGGDYYGIDIYSPGIPGGGSGSSPQEKLLTTDGIAEIASLPGVAYVVPREYFQGYGILKYNRLETWAGFMGMGIEDVSPLGAVAKEGSTELVPGGIVIGSRVPMNFYDPNTRPGQEMPPPPELMGETLKMTMIKNDADGNEIRRTVTLRVTGVLAEAQSEHDWSMYLSMDDLTKFNEWFLGKRIDRRVTSYSNAIVKAKDVDQVLDLAEQINELGFRAYTNLTYVQGINSFFLVMQITFGGVGAIALLVAAIGIANTMAMAILERTREIGLMKAIGATNRDVLSIFLGEAAGIGFIGGLGGVSIAWIAGQLINVVALAYFAGQAAQSGGPPPPSTAVVTPLWLPIFALIFATLVGLLSGLYPALRAATLIPINALKYE